MSTGKDIVLKTLEELKQDIAAVDAVSFKSTKLEDVYNEARSIEQQMGKRGSLRNMRRIEPLLETLQSYAGVLDTFCQGFTPMVWIWVDPLAYSRFMTNTESAYRVQSN